MNKNRIWVFYTTVCDGGEKMEYTQYECVKPERTAIHKKLYKMLDNDEIYTFGYMSQNEWIKCHYTKKL